LLEQGGVVGARLSCWSKAGLLEQGWVVGARLGCWSKVVQDWVVGARLGCWSKAGLLEQGWVVGARLGYWSKAGCWSKAGLLEQGWVVGARLGCWSKAGLLEQGWVVGARLKQYVSLFTPFRRGTGAFSCKVGPKTGEMRQPSNTSSTGKMKYSLRDTEKRLKRQREQRTVGMAETGGRERGEGRGEMGGGS